MIALPSTDDLLAKAVAGERLSPDEGLRLLECRDLAALGRAADEVTRLRQLARERAQVRYTWEAVTDAYERLFYQVLNQPEPARLSRDGAL